MANIQRAGFWPNDSLSSSHLIHTRRYEVASAQTLGIFMGDPIGIDTVTTGVGCVTAAITNGVVIGVSNGASYVLQLGNGARRISAKYLPASTAYTPTTRGSEQSSYIFAYDDPGTHFEAQFTTAITSDYYSYVFDNVNSTTATAGSVTTGLSGYELSGSLATTAAQWRVIYLQDSKVDNDVSATKSKAIVQYNSSAAGGNAYLTSTGAGT